MERCVSWSFTFMVFLLRFLSISCSSQRFYQLPLWAELDHTVFCLGQNQDVVFDKISINMYNCIGLFSYFYIYLTLKLKCICYKIQQHNQEKEACSMIQRRDGIILQEVFCQTGGQQCWPVERLHHNQSDEMENETFSHTYLLLCCKVHTGKVVVLEETWSL